MDQRMLQESLSDLPLGEIRYYEQIGSTNTIAKQWAHAGAPDLSLVVADEQTAGRGRLDRIWVTHPGAALAFSLVMQLQSQSTPPAPRQEKVLPFLTALGAVAVCAALRQEFGLTTEIKWPNDVLLNRRKVSGVLAETQWQGEKPTSTVLGIGINVATKSIPRDIDLRYPATSVESILEKSVDRWHLLHAVIEALLSWRSRLDSAEFLQTWENQLAFMGEWVRISSHDAASTSIQEGVVLGLSPQGCLRLRTRSGRIAVVQSGYLHLRPVDKTPE